jgi:hypothetical protein
MTVQVSTGGGRCPNDVTCGNRVAEDVLSAGRAVRRVVVEQSGVAAPCRGGRAESGEVVAVVDDDGVDVRTVFVGAQ